MELTLLLGRNFVKKNKTNLYKKIGMFCVITVSKNKFTNQTIAYKGKCELFEVKKRALLLFICYQK
jgi:hypothetical protein